MKLIKKKKKKKKFAPPNFSKIWMASRNLFITASLEFGTPLLKERVKGVQHVLDRQRNCAG
jgi:hypothetical protein